MNRTVPALITAALTTLAAAGPLTPPPGPVSSTGKTTTEIEPRIAINQTNTPGDADDLFVITSAGSYYLTGNVLGQANRNGIRVLANNVTIDLNGFSMQGNNNSLSGIIAQTGYGLTVKNGNINNWQGNGGIFAGSPDASIYQNLVLESNAGVGLRAGDNVLVSNVTASRNGSGGIQIGLGGSITNSAARNNTGNGFIASVNSIANNCTASENTGRGFSFNTNATITECAASDNGDDGFIVLNGSLVQNCNAYQNGDDGIFASGVSVRVEGCNVMINAGDGIVMNADGSIVNNTVGFHDANGNAGVRIVGSDVLVEGNKFHENGTAIRSTSTGGGNLIISNRFGGNNANFDLAGVNRLGTVQVADSNAAFTGQGIGQGGVGFTSPYANIIY